MRYNNLEFIEFFSDINNVFLDKINNAKSFTNGMIEIELFNDFVETYKRAYVLIEKNRIIDGMVLVRNSFELLMMLCGIKINSDVREEYTREDSYKRYIERRNISKKAKDYLAQSFLRNIILKKYPNIEEDYSKIYNELSKYAHPTVHRNVLRYIEREKIDMRIFYLNVAMLMPMLFLEILHEENIISEEIFEDLSAFKYIIERMTLIYLVRSEETNRLVGASKYLFADVNKEFYNKIKSENKIKFTNMENEIKCLKEEIKTALIKILSKIEYANISKKILNLKLLGK